MQRRTEVILVASLLLLAILWRFIFWTQGVYGTDALYHYSIVEQDLEKGALANDHYLGLCYEGKSTIHPNGFYALPYFLARVIGIDLAFIILPVIVGVLGLLCAYLLIKQVFSRKTALISLFFLAISLGHISKSFPFSWRGDNIVYPLLLASLFFLVKSGEEHKKWAAILAGILSGVTAWFWSGYPLVIIVFLVAIALGVCYKYIKKEKDLEENSKLFGLSILVQALVVLTLMFTTEQVGKGLMFGKYYYPFLVIAMIVSLGIVNLARKYKTHKPIIGAVIGGLLLLLLLWSQISPLMSGFGSVTSEMPLIELQNTRPHQYFFAFYILGFTSLAGLYYLGKKLNWKRAMFLGLLIPTLYLISTASRYIYIASIPIIVLTGIFFDNKKTIGKKFDILTFIMVIVMLVMLIYSTMAIPRYFMDGLFFRDLKPYEFLKEHSEKDACIVEISGRGAVVEVFAKRYAYFHPLGFDSNRERKVAELLLSTETNNTLGIEKWYIVLDYTQLSKISGMARIINKTDIGFYRMVEASAEGDANETKVLQDLDFMKHVYVNNKLYTNQTGKGCAYAYKNDFIYLKDGVCETVMYKMVTNQTVDQFKNVYFQDGYMVYKYEPATS